MEIGDASDHCRPRHQLIAIDCQVGQELDVLVVSLDEPVSGVGVIAALDRSVLAVVVDPDHLVAGLQQLRHEVTADESRSAGDEDLQSRMGPVMPQMSTTSRSPRFSFRYALCGAAMTMISESLITLSSGANVGSWTYGSVHNNFAPLNAA